MSLQAIGNSSRCAYLAPIKQVPGISDRAHQRVLPSADLTVTFRPGRWPGWSGLAITICAATAMLTTLAGSCRTSPTYWAESLPESADRYSIHDPARANLGSHGRG